MTLNIFVILLIGGGNNLEKFLFFRGFYCSIVPLVHKGNNNFEIMFPFCFDFVDVRGFDG